MLRINMMRQIAVFSLLILANCTNSSIAPEETVPVSGAAVAKLSGVDLADAGEATLAQQNDGLWLYVAATGLKQGTYGIHLHAIGKCDAPDFTTAGPHWNPAGTQHGLDNPLGAHAGDLPNLAVNAEGAGAFETKLSGKVTDALDADGLALVIHEKADDYKTDPSGNSGKRIICGVFEKR
jgi:superoxide dismutase, Cu-Zn family